MYEAVKATKATDDFRADLINGVYSPGERLSILGSGKRYDVSRSTMKTAFDMMVGEGLLERRADTYFVFQLSVDRLWQRYMLNWMIAKQAPRRYLALNPRAERVNIFSDPDDIVMGTEQYFRKVAALAGDHVFPKVIARNNALMHRMRMFKSEVIDGRGSELEEIIDALSRLDLVTHDRLIDAYHTRRINRLRDLVRVST
jgi:DNA-binding GntR family transcriptional regulator